ncbi:MAG TPA: hypothetical protein VNN80_33755 [Polyangiaceae bacterium]|nr:hypothetical protein [Polyangiaceae bacterium]
MRRVATNYGVLSSTALAASLCVLAACGGDEGNEADRVGVASECTSDQACPEVTRGDARVQLSCIRDFKGGYCGIEGCQADDDCPDGSACVAHDDGSTYCFRICAEKLECNRHRTPENEANCSSSIDFTDATRDGKACVPPSSG